MLFDLLCKELRDSACTELRIVRIPVSPGNILAKLNCALRVFLEMVLVARSVDVLTVHLPTLVLPVFGPISYLVAKLFRKPLIIRKFGGTDYNELGAFSRTLAKFSVRHADIYLAETLGLVDQARSEGLANAHWYPNNRPRSSASEWSQSVRGRCRRFVFVGHVCERKGIRELIEASGKLHLDEPVDIYGPLHDGLKETDLAGNAHLRYRGEIDSQEVVRRLAEYDALVLPTRHAGEGYPGVILEAYLAGIPVICTRWRYLSEIVDDSSGLLVTPGDSTDLQAAMARLLRDTELYQVLCKGARAKAKAFSSEDWAVRFVEYCRAAVASKERDKCASMET